MKSVFLNLFLYLSLTLYCTSTLLAAPTTQQAIGCEHEVVVQSDDWLSKIAEKVYGNVFAYPAIAEATNAKYAKDQSFATIDDLDLIEVGWKLCLPSTEEIALLLQRPNASAIDATLAAQPKSTLEVGRLLLATTTSTDNSGLLEAILPDFEARYGASVQVIAVGTGQAIQLGKNGDADVILVHARNYEDAFMTDGYGLNRQDVMYNDFVIVGPSADPAAINGLTDVTTALSQIAQTESLFISRGDDSGTHIKEQGLWQATVVPMITLDSLAGKTQLKPEGNWYLSGGQGMGATLTIAHEQQSYTLTDRATFLARTLEGIDLEILVEGDSRLFNPYGVIAVNPENHTAINHAGATAFIEWLTSRQTQYLISQFGVAEFGTPLFMPDSVQWNEIDPKL